MSNVRISDNRIYPLNVTLDKTLEVYVRSGVDVGTGLKEVGVFSHSGRTDSSGGHYNHKTGGYHSEVAYVKLL